MGVDIMKKVYQGISFSIYKFPAEIIMTSPGYNGENDNDNDFSW